MAAKHDDLVRMLASANLGDDVARVRIGKHVRFHRERHATGLPAILDAVQHVRILAITIAALSAVAGVVACSDGDGNAFPGYSPYSYGRDTNATEPVDASLHDATAKRPPTSDASSDAGHAADTSADASTDASDAGDGGAPNAFTDASTFAPDAGELTERANHNFAGNTPTTSPAKQACLDCHKNGGAAMAFAFGGTVFADDGGIKPAVGVEVRVRADNGTVTSAYTDVHGNFFARTAAATFPATTGARTAAAAASMVAPAVNGNCNSCHNGAGQRFIHVP